MDGHQYATTKKGEREMLPSGFNQTQHLYPIQIRRTTIKTAQGKIVGLNIECEGHKIQLICSYMPNKHQDTVQLVETHLEGLLEQTLEK
jgi:hypothetical protein